jgi:hypothetical protein
MTFTSRALAVAAAALAVALTGPALSAHAAGLSWKTLSTTAGGKVQACKVPTTDTGPWKVRMRVDATKATGRVQGSGYATNAKGKTLDTWKSGWVTKGHISAIGDVRLPRGAGYTLNAGIGTDNMGNGGTFTSREIPHC